MPTPGRSYPKGRQASGAGDPRGGTGKSRRSGEKFDPSGRAGRKTSKGASGRVGAADRFGRRSTTGRGSAKGDGRRRAEGTEPARATARATGGREVPPGLARRPATAGLGTGMGRRWGALARRGARELLAPEGDRRPPASVPASRVAMQQGASAPYEEIWVLEEQQTEAARPTRRVGPGKPAYRDLASGPEGIPAPGGVRRRIPRPVLEQVNEQAGASRGPKLAARLADATYAYEKDRYEDARRILAGLVKELPAAGAVRELYGLTLYRLGRWAAAAKELEAHRSLEGSMDQLPTLADCYRAMGRYAEAEAIWEELRRASPSGDLVVEGRIVAAGCRADQGDLQGAIALLEKTSRRVAHPATRHLRQWYFLADLYERAGDLPRARQLFSWVAEADPDAYDVAARLRSLS